MWLLVLVGVAAVLAAAVAAGRAYPPVSGSIPLLHVGPRGFDLAAAPDQQGRVFLVTGASRGLGFETVVALAQKNATVVLGCRKAADVSKVVAEVRRRVPGGGYTLRGLADLEMGSLSSVAGFVEAYRKSGMALDCMVLNAGVMHVPHQVSDDGFEMHMAVNHFGTAALAFGLLGTLMKSARPRVVVMSSLGHFHAPAGGVLLSKAAMNDPKAYATRQHAYGQSKLANIVFVKALQKHLDAAHPEKKVYVNGVHPGGVVSDLMRHTLGAVLGETLARAVQRPLYWPTADGALTQVACAIDPRVEAEDIRGQYWVPIARNRDDAASPLARDAALADALWKFTIDALAETPASGLLASVRG